MAEFEQVMETIWAILAQFGLSVLAAIAIFIIGSWMAKAISRFVKRLLSRRGLDSMLVSFVSTLIYYAIIAFVIIAALNRVGIQTASFIAVLGAAGLAIGLALQGSLENFAAGVLMLIFRPFKVGDYIEGGGTAGIVQAISLFTTTLDTPDNRRVIVPNGKLNSDTITNFSANDTRRIDMVLGVSYDDNLDQVKQAILDVLNTDPRVLKDPAPMVGVLELADSSVNLAVRPWVQTADYWDTFFALYETLKIRMDAEGISIPYPQQDVHLLQQSQN